MKINKFTILLVLALLLFIAPFVIYYINFSDMPILKDNSAWGSFGSYLSGSFSVVIAGLTLTSLFILLQTLTETIESNQRQITISQHESELNNFNFITAIIIKNIENKSLVTNIYYPTHYFDEAKNIPHLCRNFAYCYNYSKDNYYLFMNDEKSYHLNVNKFINELHNNKPLKALVNDYAKKYALLIDLDILNYIHPLIKALCDKILKCTDDNQKELLKSILYSSIDNSIIFWSLALINNNLYDEFMLAPKEITHELNEW